MKLSFYVLYTHNTVVTQTKVMGYFVANEQNQNDFLATQTGIWAWLLAIWLSSLD